VDQEESILLLFPDVFSNTKRNIISQRTNDHIAVWEVKNNKERATVTGIKTVH
jgi:hypothetical protein